MLHKLSDKLFAPLRVNALRAQVLETRNTMKKSQLSTSITGAVKEYFSKLREMLREANALALEVEQMVLGVQRRFAEELGWSLSPPMQFSLDTYIAELERAEQAYRSQFGAFAVLTRDRWSLMERFFETVVAKSREIFAAAERDTEAWVKSLLPPIELQVREQRAQLRKRAESISKIRDAQGSLGPAIRGELMELDSEPERVGHRAVLLGSAGFLPAPQRRRYACTRSSGFGPSGRSILSDTCEPAPSGLTV